MLVKVSSLLLPGQSGMYKVLGFTTLINPGSPPLGDTSGKVPSRAVPMLTNGDFSINEAQWGSI